VNALARQQTASDLDYVKAPLPHSATHKTVMNHWSAFQEPLEHSQPTMKSKGGFSNAKDFSSTTMSTKSPENFAEMLLDKLAKIPVTAYLNGQKF